MVSTHGSEDAISPHQFLHATERQPISIGDCLSLLTLFLIHHQHCSDTKNRVSTTSNALTPSRASSFKMDLDSASDGDSDEALGIVDSYSGPDRAGFPEWPHGGGLLPPRMRAEVHRNLQKMYTVTSNTTTATAPEEDRSEPTSGIAEDVELQILLDGQLVTSANLNLSNNSILASLKPENSIHVSLSVGGNKLINKNLPIAEDFEPPTSPSMATTSNSNYLSFEGDEDRVSILSRTPTPLQWHEMSTSPVSVSLASQTIEEAAAEILLSLHDHDSHLNMSNPGFPYDTISESAMRSTLSRESPQQISSPSMSSPSMGPSSSNSAVRQHPIEASKMAGSRPLRRSRRAGKGNNNREESMESEISVFNEDDWKNPKSEKFDSKRFISQPSSAFANDPSLDHPVQKFINYTSPDFKFHWSVPADQRTGAYAGRRQGPTQDRWDTYEHKENLKDLEEPVTRPDLAHLKRTLKIQFVTSMRYMPIPFIVWESRWNRLALHMIPVTLANHLFKKEDGFLSRPSIKIVVPDALKALLVDDWENVTKSQQLVPLPHKYPVNTILAEYQAYEAPKRATGSASADILEEVVAGLKEYFEKCLGRILLYRYVHRSLLTYH